MLFACMLLEAVSIHQTGRGLDNFGRVLVIYYMPFWYLLCVVYRVVAMPACLIHVS